MTTAPEDFGRHHERRIYDAEKYLRDNPDVREQVAAEASNRSQPADPAESFPKGVDRSQPVQFPKAAWRGAFADYRAAMDQATEASDVFHFASLWARCAVALSRRVHFRYGMQLFANVYIVGYGPTGDRKTTAMRQGTELGGQFKIICGTGSGEGIADEFSEADPGQGLLLYAEEFSQILRQGRWEGATLIPFLTQCFDCPAQHVMRFRKKPINLDRPTPSLLAGTTPDWFWPDFRLRDFHGGFGNRLFFLTGMRKPSMALPESPDVGRISSLINELPSVAPCEAHVTVSARSLWEEFYRAWDAEETRRDPLCAAVVRRVPAYVLKLAMVYAAIEHTLPEITLEQLAASILVGRYGEACARELLALQNAGTNPTKELERRILAVVHGAPNGVTTKRNIYKTLWRLCLSTEAFNRAFESLIRAGELFTKSVGRGSVWVSGEPFDQ